MTVLEMISDTYEVDYAKKDKKEKRKKKNKYAQYSTVDQGESDDAGDTQPVTDFPIELLESESDEEAPKRTSTEQLRVLYTIFLDCNKAGNPIYQAIMAEVKTYLQSNSNKLKSFDIQQIVVYARLRDKVMEYYCQIPTKSFDVVGEIELAEGAFSSKAEL